MCGQIRGFVSVSKVEAVLVLQSWSLTFVTVVPCAHLYDCIFHTATCLKSVSFVTVGFLSLGAFVF